MAMLVSGRVLVSSQDGKTNIALQAVFGQPGVGTSSMVPSVASTIASAYGTEMVKKSFSYTPISFTF